MFITHPIARVTKKTRGKTLLQVPEFPQRKREIQNAPLCLKSLKTG